jgi:hypothetical protein
VEDAETGLKRHVVYLVLALCVAGAVIGGLVLIAQGRSGKASAAGPWPFADVSASQLAPHGIVLSSPAGAPPATAVGNAAANRAAINFMGSNASVLETQYMHCVDNTASNPEINQDCYVVVVNPSAIHFAGSPQVIPPSATWGIVMVDPAGNIIEAAGGSN